MITNENQCRITKKQLLLFQKAIETFNHEEVSARVGSDVLAKAELDALRSEAEVLSKQIWEYKNLPC